MANQGARVIPDIQEPPLSEMDLFAQTRETDDLFESEIQVAVPPPGAPREPRNKGARGRGGNSHCHQYRDANNPQHSRGGKNGEGRGEGKEGSDIFHTAASGPPVSPTSAGHASPSANIADRALSGGIKKPKLSEDELARRMELIKLNNERLTERRRKAEEDESSYQVLEEQRKSLEHKRSQKNKNKSEAEKNRRELEQEREKNRQRKLKAVQTREWDSEKKEEDYNPKGYNPRYRRGAHGAVASPSRPAASSNVPPAPPTTTISNDGNKKPAENEWPTLPGIDGKASDDKKQSNRIDEQVEDNKENESFKSTSLEVGQAGGAVSWAEQVEADYNRAEEC